MTMKTKNKRMKGTTRVTRMRGPYKFSAGTRIQTNRRNYECIASTKEIAVFAPVNRASGNIRYRDMFVVSALVRQAKADGFRYSLIPTS